MKDMFSMISNIVLFIMSCVIFYLSMLIVGQASFGEFVFIIIMSILYVIFQFIYTKKATRGIGLNLIFVLLVSSFWGLLFINGLDFKVYKYTSLILLTGGISMGIVLLFSFIAFIKKLINCT